MVISLTKYRNPNNTIRVAVTMNFTANWQFSPELPAVQSLVRVLLLTANNENLLWVPADRISFNIKRFDLKFKLNFVDITE